MEFRETPQQNSPAPVVLLVDDNPDNLKLLARMLSENGFRVKASNNGRFALKSVQNEPPTLILLDIMMPEMDGFEVCRRLKADPQTAEIPIIFISALNNVTDKIRAFTAGGVDYITKPFHEAEVLARVRTHTILQHIQQNLERLVAERTAENSKMAVQLHQAQKMEAIGTLAGGISHDFNNILGAILGYSELAMDELEPGSKALEFIKSVYAAGIRAKQLVSQVLAFSRREDNNLESLMPHLIVKEVCQLLRASLPATIEMKLLLDKSGSVMANPTHLHQIVMNLCTNAKHAMGDSGGVLEIKLQMTDIGENNELATDSGLSPGPYVLLKISDTGIGMDTATMAQIFDPYFTTKKKGEGTGLGLAVVHGIVTSYGGHIQVESEEGVGTVFYIYLPRIAKSTTVNQTVLPEELPGGSEHILIVDDEESLVNILQKNLQKLGYKVDAFLSSPEALAAFTKEPAAFDLVLTDMIMPKMTGLQLAREIIAIRADIPIIICTGFSDQLSQESAKAVGIKEFILKPFQKQDIAKLIRKTLEEA